MLLAAGPSLAGAQASALTLEATVRRALDAHPNVAMASERVVAARGTRLTARSWTNPVLNYELEHEPVEGTAGIVTQRKISTFAVVPLEPLFQRWPRTAQANAELDRATADLRDTKRRTTVAAAQGYFDAATAEVTLSATQEVHAWLDSLVRYTRNRVREGAAAEADLIRLEVEQGRVETDLAMTRVELARTRASLGVLVGLDSAIADVSGGCDTLSAPLPPLADLLAVARKNRPDVAAAAANVGAANAGVAFQRSAVFREVGAMIGVMSMEGKRSLMAGAAMPFPIFDQNRGEIQRASAERRVALLEKSLVERQVSAEVTGAYAAVQTLSAQLARVGRLVQRAEEGRRIAEGAYREGATSLVQVLDAARAYEETRLLSYRTVFGWRQSIVELNAAIGSEALTTISTGGGR